MSNNNIWQATIVKNGGDVVSGADIEVFDEGTGNPATIYNTSTSTTPMSNPFASDANGTAVFYAAAGKYKITATQASTGFASVPLRDVRLGEGGAKDTGTAATEIPLNSDLGTSATKDTGTGTTQIPLNSDILHYNTVPVLGTPNGSQVTPFLGWTSPSHVSTTLEFTTTSGTAWASKSSAERELLTAMGRENAQHISQNFNVYRVVINSGREGLHAGPYAEVKLFNQAPVTVAAFTKLLSGNAPSGYYVSGMSSSWGLTGEYKPGSPPNYLHCHPYGNVSNSACTFLVALPGSTLGYVDLTNPLNWWMFPNKSGGEG